MFDIRFIDTVPDSELGNAALEGMIILGDESEHFTSLIGFWSPSDYIKQWHQAIKRIVETRLPSCLITSIYDQDEADVGSWWLLYPNNDRVIAQDSLLLFREMKSRFDTSNPYLAIPPHRSQTKEGFDISEWDMPISDFADYLARYS